MSEQSPMVTVAHPSKAMLRIINPIMRLLVHTPIAGAARKQFMVLTVHGRKTGRQYEIPLSAHFIDNTLYAMTDAAWKYNFRDGATAEVLLDGKTTTMHGELIDDGATVANLFHRCAESYGVKRAQRMMGLTFRDQRIPTLEEFTEAAAREHLAAIKLTPTQAAT
ncbi:hypothetical protein [Mycolicibacterium sp.]|uniref:hypothetical protein n=1 Tax=Mycolicibacterium sp. TaxID=2320850 RepID=UPI0037CC5A1A